MIDTPRQRWTTLAWASLCAGLFAVLAVLVDTNWSPLIELDLDTGQWPYEVTRENDWLRRFWIGLGHATDTLAMAIATVVAAIALSLKSHRRAAAWALVVMVANYLAFTGLKLLIARDRPVWDDPVQVLQTYSFPSGHASTIATAMGIAIVLGLMLIRRRGVRRLLVTAAVLFALLVAADRIFLGVHNLSDVSAGLLLGSAIVLLSLLLFDPRPRSIALANQPLADAVPSTDRILAAILNPVKVDDPAGFKAMVEKMADESGWHDVVWWETTVEDTGYAMAHEAAVSGADLVLAIGGDGTIRAVCEELAGTGVPVGVVPAGTGNLLARNLGIPLYLRAAVDVALNGQDRAIDMVEVSGDDMEDATFLVMAGMGFDAAIMEGVNEDVKRRLGWLAYVFSGLKALMFPTMRLEVSVDDGPFTRHRARTVVVGNVGSLQGGMVLLPDAAIDDGTLDVVLLYPRRFLSWVPLVFRVLSKREQRAKESIARFTGSKVVIRSGTDVPRQIDGDYLGQGRELTCICVHGRLLVRVAR